VDDGSDVPVSTIVMKAVQQHILHFDIKKLPVTILRLPNNLGKGRAIARGVTASHGDAVLFTDVDLSVSIETIRPLLAALKKYPVVIGSRRIRESKIVVHQPFIRESAGRVFTALSNMLCKTDVADVTCGFKGFRREAAVPLFSLMKIDRWVFDTELMYLARKKKLPVYELPVAWVNKSGSKVRPWDSVASLADLFRIRWNDMRGEYNMRDKRQETRDKRQETRDKR
jgi:dolichyl-phosphate beta-glucosyltransferase